MRESITASVGGGRPLLLLLAASIAMGCASAPISGVQPDGSFRESFDAWAVSLGTSNPPVIPPGTTAMVQINITRWTTPEENSMLLDTLKEGGQPALVTKLQDQQETGWIMNRSRTTSPSPRVQALAGTSAPSYRLRYAWQIDKGAGNRRIVAALDRPIGFAEAARQPRWRDHDVTLVVLDLDKNGNGTGQLAIGVQMTLSPEGELVVENFGTEPVRLNNVRRR